MNTLKKLLLLSSIFLSGLCSSQKYYQVVVQAGKGRQDTVPIAGASSGYTLVLTSTLTPAWSSPSTIAWLTTGNSGITNSNFLGTINNIGLNFRVNNSNVGRMDSLNYFDWYGGIKFNGALMPYYSSAYQAGTLGQVLTSQGAGVAPQWSKQSLSISPFAYFVGDSWTAGYQGLTVNYPQVCMANLPNWTFYNAGVSGFTSYQILHQVSSMIARGNGQVFVGEAGANDILNNYKALYTEDSIQAAVNLIHAAGYKVIWCNIAPINGMTAIQVAKMDSINAWEASGSFVNVDYKINIHDQLHSPSGNSDSVALRFIPQVAPPHFNISGYQVWGNYIFNNSTFSSPITTYTSSVSFNGTLAFNEGLDSSKSIFCTGINSSGNILLYPLNISAGAGTGSQTNCAIGTSSLHNNTTGYGNNSIGYENLQANTTGFQNTALGNIVMPSLTSGNDNIGIGDNPLNALVSGIGNIAIGKGALAAYLGNYNVAIGYSAASKTTGVNNTAIGEAALQNNVSGTDNTAIGQGALQANTASKNTAIGSSALISNTSGTQNWAAGWQGMYYNSTGSFNTEGGYNALFHYAGSNCNTAFGNFAMGVNSAATGNGNTAIGNYALYNNIGGTHNVFLGDSAGISSTATVNAIGIGYDVINTTSNTAVIGPSSQQAFSLGAGSYCITVVQTAVTTGTVTVANTTQEEEFTATTPSVTITPPTATKDGQLFSVTTYTSTVTITWNGTFNHTPATITTATPAHFRWDATNSTWIFENYICLIAFAKRKKEDETE